jgi:hypothetical protein
MDLNLQPVDHAALKTNQALIIFFSLVAFILNLAWLAALVAVVMIVGTILGVPGFGFIYQRLVKPAGWLKPDVLADNLEPHRFAQGLGGIFMTIGSLLLLIGLIVPGWVLVWFVIALAALNLFGGFCAGCAIYYWLNRLGVPGFSKYPPQGIYPGKRPKVRI